MNNFNQERSIKQCVSKSGNDYTNIIFSTMNFTLKNDN